MRSRSTALAVILCLLTLTAIVPFASAQGPQAGSGFIAVVPQTLTIPTATPTTGTLTAIKITRITNQGGTLCWRTSVCNNCDGDHHRFFHKSTAGRDRNPDWPKYVSSSAPGHRSNIPKFAGSGRDCAE